MSSIQTLKVKDFIKKINKVESMLDEIKNSLSLLDKDFEESVEKGEKDIKEGRVTVCETKEDLDNFFASI